MSVFIIGTILQPKGEADMRISQTAQKIKLNQVMDISIDVHKDSLNFFFEAGGKGYSDECSNRTTVISKQLEAYHQIAAEHGMKTLRIICEPTGQYQNKLFRTARRMGFFTCFVNAESVAKCRLCGGCGRMRRVGSRIERVWND
jgi:hypothetical protein